MAAGNDLTSVKLDAALAGGKDILAGPGERRRRGRSEFSSTINFSLGAAVDLSAPQLETPEPNATVAGLRPNFVLRNTSRTGPVGTIYYRFEVADNNSFSPLTARGRCGTDAGGPTTWAPDVDLPTGKTLYWHARTVDPQNNVAPARSATPARVHRVEDGRRIDASQVTWLSPACTDVSNWKITSQVTDTSVTRRPHLRLPHEGRPVAARYVFGIGVDNIEGNMLIVAMSNGKWSGGGIVTGWDRRRVSEGAAPRTRLAWTNPGRAVDASSPDRGWASKVGLLVSTPSSDRIPIRTINERSNIKMIIWPYSVPARNAAGSPGLRTAPGVTD